MFSGGLGRSGVASECTEAVTVPMVYRSACVCVVLFCSVQLLIPIGNNEVLK